jgi:hypothetical protein
MFQHSEQMHASLERCFELEGNEVVSVHNDSPAWAGEIDALARNAVFNPDANIRANLRRFIRSAAQQQGILSQSLCKPYESITKGQMPDRCLLTIRLGGHCYDLARLVLRTAKNAGFDHLIFEQGWTGQSIWEFSALMEVAALREGWNAPLYLRAGLRPLASDNLPGAFGTENLCDAIDKALAANIHNFQLRVSQKALGNQTTRNDLAGLLNYIADRSGERASCASLALLNGPTLPEFDQLQEHLQLLKNQLTSHHACPKILAFSPKVEQALLLDLQKQPLREEILGYSMGGLPPKEVLERLEEAGSRSPILERRVEFDWAARIVMHSEFSANRRLHILNWLNRDSEEEIVNKEEFLRTHEYETLGHFDFEIWNLESMPQMRAELIRELWPLLKQASGR